MHSLKDEIAFFFSGRGMPYEKVSLMVAVVVTVLLSILLGNNFSKDAKVAIIDVDNSKYSHEIIEQINASTFMKVTTVLNAPVEPKTLFYRDQNVAVVYLPQDLEKNRYSQAPASIGVFYDNTNNAQTGEVKAALNEIIAIENQKTAQASGAAGAGSLALNDRELFNPVNSSSNGEVLGFLFFFSSMFFVFATIGMVPRLKLENKWEGELASSPFSLMLRLVPYGACLLTAIFVGLAILRTFGDLTFSGNLLVFLLSLLLYIPSLGILSLLFGWTAANPGIASSRMILFVPGGFILGGPTGPLTILSEWVKTLSHIFPLTWEYHFTRDIISRGAGFMDCGKQFGELMIYLAVVIVIFCFCFHRARLHLPKKDALEKTLAMEEIK